MRDAPRPLVPRRREHLAVGRDEFLLQLRQAAIEHPADVRLLLPHLKERQAEEWPPLPTVGRSGKLVPARGLQVPLVPLWKLRVFITEGNLYYLP